MSNLKFNLVVFIVISMFVFGACSGSDEVVEESTTVPTVVVSEIQDASVYAKNYSNPERLASVQWLNDHLEDENLVIIDVRSMKDGVAEKYNAGHIPGAINIPGNTTFQIVADGVKGMLPTSSHIEEVLSKAGVKPSDTIVFYDDIKSLWASRALWGMDVYGHTNTKLLDGDIKLWETKGYELSQNIPVLQTTDYKFTSLPNNDLIIGWEEVKSSIENGSSVVCDTRSPDEYTGKDVRAERGGHIPGAVNVEWSANSAIDGTFLPAAELKNIYDSAQISSDKGVYTLCQTAVRATHTWFVLHALLGYDDVRVYDGSWTEWGNKTLEDTPIDIKA